MEGLANYGSDDEVDGTPIAGDVRNIKSHRHRKDSSHNGRRRHHSKSPSSSQDEQWDMEGDKSRHQSKSMRDSKSDKRSKNKEVDASSHKVERYRERELVEHKGDRNRERSHREKRTYDDKKESSGHHETRERRHRDTKEERHYKDRREDRTDRHKRDHENGKHNKEYRKRKEDDYVNKEHSARYDKYNRDDGKYKSHKSKDYALDKNSEHSARDKYEKSAKAPSTSTEVSGTSSPTTSRQMHTNNRAEAGGSYKWLPAVNNANKVMTKTPEPIATALPAMKPIGVPLPVQAKPSVGIPSYYNPSVVNVNKYAEQAQKRKLLWSGKKPEDNASKWGKPQFSEDSDGKVASKFLRLMGIKNAESSEGAKEKDTSASADPNAQIREKMFTSMEQQYEVARQVTHTMRGVGLGFSSLGRPF